MLEKLEKTFQLPKLGRILGRCTSHRPSPLRINPGCELNRGAALRSSHGVAFIDYKAKPVYLKEWTRRFWLDVCVVDRRFVDLVSLF